MIDRREQILLRLMNIFGDVQGILTVVRNREAISGDKRPAIIMHDAAEESAGFENRPRGTPKGYMILSPQIYVLLGARAADVGTEVNQFRAALIPAILLDTELRGLCSSPLNMNRGGDIEYGGCGLDTTTGETREARLEMKFDFTYMLDPMELQS